MGELLAAFSLQEIVVFLVLFATALKGIITFWDWGIDRLKKVFSKKAQEEANNNDIMEKLTQINTKIDEIQEKQIKNENAINLLMQSDKDDIKSWITEQHHYFCYEVKQIDDYSLDCIERRYAHYTEEGGNSYVRNLMEDIRKLPRISTNKLLTNSNKEQK